MFNLIAGPCVIESEELVMRIAEQMKRITDELGISYTFKASFDKANRTSFDSFRGLGMEEGLRILQKVKETYDLPICTDIHEAWQAEKVAQVCDMIQIPAFLCRQTDLLVAAAYTGKTVHIKKAQFMAPWDMAGCVEKVRKAGNNHIIITERGTSFGFNNLVVDMTGLLEMKKLGVPVYFDATHSVQKPAINGTSSGGNREYAEQLAKAAVAVGIDGLFIETHPDPESAKSDSAVMIPLDRMKPLLTQLQKIYYAVNGGDQNGLQ